MVENESATINSGGGVDNPALEVCEAIAPSLHYINTPPPPYATSDIGGEISIASPRSSVLSRAEPPPYSVAIKETSHAPLVLTTVVGVAGDHSGGQPPPRVALDTAKELYI